MGPEPDSVKLEEEAQKSLQSEQAGLIPDTKPMLLSVPNMIIPKAPETGQGTTIETELQTIVLLLALCISGLLLAIWWFIPTESQRIRKNFTKSHKNP